MSPVDTEARAQAKASKAKAKASQPAVAVAAAAAAVPEKEKEKAAKAPRVAQRVAPAHPPLPAKLKAMLTALTWFLQPEHVAQLALAASPDIGAAELADTAQAAGALLTLVPRFSASEEQIAFFAPIADVAASYKAHVKGPLAEHKKRLTAQRRQLAEAEKLAKRLAAGGKVRARKAKKAPEPEPEPEPEAASEPEASDFEPDFAADAEPAYDIEHTECDIEHTECDTGYRAYDEPEPEGSISFGDTSDGQSAAESSFDKFAAAAATAVATAAATATTVPKARKARAKKVESDSEAEPVAKPVRKRAGKRAVAVELQH